MNSVGLANISFPVYRLGLIEPMHEAGISFYFLAKDINYSDAEYQIQVVDDKTRPEPTLAMRRLHLKDAGVTLFALRRAIFFIGDLVKLAKANLWFIDANGLIFQYEKTRKVPLVYKKVKKIIPMPAGGAIIEVEGLAERFKTLFVPSMDQKYAGLLLLDKAHILYGLYDAEYKNTQRAI